MKILFFYFFYNFLLFKLVDDITMTLALGQFMQAAVQASFVFGLAQVGKVQLLSWQDLKVENTFGDLGELLPELGPPVEMLLKDSNYIIKSFIWYNCSNSRVFQILQIWVWALCLTQKKETMQGGLLLYCYMDIEVECWALAMSLSD